MLKKRNLILLVMMFPTVVYASSGGGSDSFPLVGALFTEAFCSIHMSIFVLKPLSEMFGGENSKKLFWKMFYIRVGILLFFDIFITTFIALVDFFAVFIGAFLVVPICAAKTKTLINPKSNQVISNQVRSNNSTVNSNSAMMKGISLKCANCGAELKIDDKFCQYCGSAFDGNNVVVSVDEGQSVGTTVPKKIAISPSNFDNMYSLSENMMVEEFINRALSRAGIDKNTDLIPKEALKRKKILNMIFSVLVFIYVSLIFFHFSMYTYIIGFIILFIFYRMTKNFDLIKYLKKEIKSRPNEKVSNIVMNVKHSFMTDDSKKVFLSSIVVAIALPLVIFVNPRILYEKVDNGYGVRFYTFGLTNFTSVAIPETYKGEKVVSLRGNTFSNMFFLEKVSLPNTITEIRGQAFKNAYKLNNVNLPSNLEYLGGGAFYNCKSLTSIVIPDSVIYIGGEAFYNAESLENVRLSNNITEIRGNTFENCDSLKSINIPDRVTRVGGHAFYGCYSLEEVVITENSQLNEIGSSAFRRCNNLYSITIPYGTYVNERAFKESPTDINYFGQLDVVRNVVTIDNNGAITYIYTPKYGDIALTISNATVIGEYLHLTLNLNGGINKSVDLVCDGSTAYIYDDFYIVTTPYRYKATTTTFEFYY